AANKSITIQLVLARSLLNMDLVDYHRSLILEHSGVIMQHSGVIMQHSGVIMQHSGVIMQHSGVIMQHSGRAACFNVLYLLQHTANEDHRAAAPSVVLLVRSGSLWSYRPRWQGHRSSAAQDRDHVRFARQRDRVQREDEPAPNGP